MRSGASEPRWAPPPLRPFPIPFDVTSAPRSLRPAHPDELDAIRALLRACDLPHDDLTPEHLSHFFVAAGGASLRGCVGLEPGDDAALLRSLAVRPGARGQELGGRLLTAAERRARQMGLRALYLLTTTAAGYFERHGYVRVERDALTPALQKTEEAARLCPASATCMRKRLAAKRDGLAESDSS